jgi:hypothetical protein
MAAIYSQAHQVIIWLGSGDDDQRSALEAIGLHSPSMQTQEELDSLLALCENEYWERTWVIQEVMLAKKLVLMYDNQRIPWSSWVILHRKEPYLRTVENQEQSDKTIKNRFEVSKGRLMVFEYYRFREKQRQFKLKELLVTFGQSKCADPRDRIFALLGLCEEGVKGLVEPDYNMEIEDLYYLIVVSCFPDSTADAQMLAGVLGFPNEWEGSRPQDWVKAFSICRLMTPSVVSEHKPEAQDWRLDPITRFCVGCYRLVPGVRLPGSYRNQSAHYFVCQSGAVTDNADHLLLLPEPAQEDRKISEIAFSIGATLFKERHTLSVLLYGAEVHEYEGAQFLSTEEIYQGSWIFPYNDLRNAIPVPTVSAGHSYHIEESHLSKTWAISKFISPQLSSSFFSACVTHTQKQKKIKHRDATSARGMPDADGPNTTPSPNFKQDRGGYV